MSASGLLADMNFIWLDVAQCPDSDIRCFWAVTFLILDQSDQSHPVADRTGAARWLQIKDTKTAARHIGESLQFALRTQPVGDQG